MKDFINILRLYKFQMCPYSQEKYFLKTLRNFKYSPLNFIFKQQSIDLRPSVESFFCNFLWKNFKNNVCGLKKMDYFLKNTLFRLGSNRIFIQQIIEFIVSRMGARAPMVHFSFLSISSYPFHLSPFSLPAEPFLLFFSTKMH